VLKTENGFEGSCLGCGGGESLAGSADSKKEKSASAQESTAGSTGSTDGGGGVEGLAGSDGSVLEANAEKSSSSELNTTGSASTASGTGVELATPAFGAFSCTSMTAGASTGGSSLLLFSGVIATRFSSGVEVTGLLAGFRIPGPIGPSSALSGTKLFGPNNADVGDIAPRKRAICILSTEGWLGGVLGVDSKVDRVLSRVAVVEFGSAEMDVDTVGLEIISPHSSSSSAGAVACCC
jgi:hypothetical protein